MKKIFAFLLLSGLLSIPAFAGSVTVLAGYVMPDGDSDIYDQNALETTFETSDLNDFGGSARYDHFLGNYVNLNAGLSFYHSDTDVQDVEFTRENGAPILRGIHLEIVPLEVGVHLLPAGREMPIIPYVGGGFGFYYWEYEELGDFVINRNSNDPRVITGDAYSDGWDPGFHIEAGVYIPVSRSVAVVGEAKYWKAEGDLDVAGFDPAFEPIDLSGKMFSGGVSVWF